VRSGKGFSVAELAQRLEMDERSLRLFLPDYRSFRIAKRRGGDRLIQAPTEPTKDLQRKILKRILGPLRAHPAAHAYERGHSIATNARCHEGQAVVIKLDLKDFFPSTRVERVQRYFQWVGWNREAAELLTRLVTLDGGLPQGGPRVRASRIS
jgi:RNA-directed DNA polymerase